MTKEVAGIKLEQLEEPIQEALKSYESVSEGTLTFDLDSASILEPTTDKPNSARSATDAKYKGETIGKLFVIAFKPEDGTGDESGYKIDNLKDENGNSTIKRIPRNKTGVHSEGHLTVLTKQLEEPNKDPDLFAGTFDLLGLDGNIIRKIGELGQSATVTTDELQPFTTLTVGYTPSGERFGDPHAVYSPLPETLQVCAFLAITDEMHEAHPEILESLKPQEPRQL